MVLVEKQSFLDIFGPFWRRVVIFGLFRARNARFGKFGFQVFGLAGCFGVGCALYVRKRCLIDFLTFLVLSIRCFIVTFTPILALNKGFVNKIGRKWS